MQLDLASFAHQEPFHLSLEVLVSHVPTEPFQPPVVLRAALLVFVALNPAQLPTFASLALQESSLLQEDFASLAPTTLTLLQILLAVV